ncbi:hypothetical protein TNCV_4851081 [Trichonephila clavipes]|nr:hypothetical protein TNCV_4851081 [Trichonephila clavipes]
MRYSPFETRIPFRRKSDGIRTGFEPESTRLQTEGHIQPYRMGDFATRGVLMTDLVILSHGQVTRTAPELAQPLLNSIPMGGHLSSRQINVNRSSPTRWGFSGTDLELMARQSRVRYLDF